MRHANLLAVLALTLSFQSHAILINEVDYDQPGFDNAEFVELYNETENTVSLFNWALMLINGSTGSFYSGYDLTGFSIAAHDYFVICGDTGLGLVPNCDMYVPTSGTAVDQGTNFLQNGPPDAIALLDPNRLIVDALSYEGDTLGYTEGSGVGLTDYVGAQDIGFGLSRCGVDTNQNNVDFLFRAITPGAANDCPIASVSTPSSLPLVGVGCLLLAGLGGVRRHRMGGVLR